MKCNSIIEATNPGNMSETEHVTLADIKRHLNMQFDTSGSYQFNDDDTYLTSLIGIAREVIEEFTGLSLTKKQWTAIVRNELGDIEIPYGPIVSVTSVKNQDGIAVSYTLRGNKFKTIEFPRYDYMEVIYIAGYDPDNATPYMPRGLKRAWLEQIAWSYTHRGEENEFKLCQQALNTAAPYTRKSFIL
jgi:hypothetical protein